MTDVDVALDCQNQGQPVRASVENLENKLRIPQQLQLILTRAASDSLKAMKIEEGAREQATMQAIDRIQNIFQSL